jgi:hypothetical protein
MATYNSGTDTVTVGGSEGTPDTLDSIVSAVANTAKAKKVGLLRYEFNFAILNNASGWLEFPAQTETILFNCQWRKNGSTGGVIFRERAIARLEGTTTSATGSSPVKSLTGFKIKAYRDVSGVNPRIIIATQGRYDIIGVADNNTTNFQITGLDVETYEPYGGAFSGWGGSAVNQILADGSSSISFLRILSRESEGQYLEARTNTTLSDLYFERFGRLGFHPNGISNAVLRLIRPTFNFLGTAQSIEFAEYAIGLIALEDPVFPNGAWNGQFKGYADFTSSAVILSVSFTLSLQFLAGSTAVPMRVRHAPSVGSNIDGTATGGTISTLLLASSRTAVAAFNTWPGADLAGDTVPTWGVRARLYHYKIAGPDSLYTAATFAATTSLTSQCVAVPGLTLSESAAAALTDYSLTASGANGGVLAISGAGTAENDWHFYRQWISTFANFGSNDTWGYNAGLLDIAGWSLEISGSRTGNVKSLVSTTITGTITTSGSQFGGVITSNKSLTLSGCTFAPGTTINTSAGAISIAVDPAQIANITAGANVTIFSQSTLTLTGFPNGSRVVISQSGRTQDLVNGQNSPYSFVGPAGGYGVVISAAGFKDLTFSVDLSTSQAIPVSMIAESSTQQVDQALSRFIQFMRSDSRYSTMLTEALAVSGLRDEAFTVRLGLWSSAEFKVAWNALIASSSITDPTSGEVAVWTGYLSQSGYMGISFTVAGGIN